MMRRTLAHCATLCAYAVNFALVLIVLALGYTLLSRDIRVPGILLHRIERELHRRGLEVDFDTATFDPTGRIFLTGMRLVPARFGEPVFEASRALVSLDRLRLLAFDPVLSRLQVDDVRLICPSSISPSGIPETIARLATARIEHDGGLWTFDSVLATVSEITIAAHGTYAAASPKEPSAAPNLDALLEKFAKYAPEAVHMEQFLANVSEPRLSVAFHGGTHAGIAVRAELFAAELHDPRFGEAINVNIRADASFGGHMEEGLAARGHADLLRHEGLGEIYDLDLTAAWKIFPEKGNPWPTRVELSARKIVHPKAAVDATVATIFPAAYPNIEGDVSVYFAGEPIAAHLVGNVEERSGRVDIRTRLGRDFLATVSETLGRDVTAYATVDVPPDIEATACIDAGGKLRRADFRVLSGPVSARGVALDRARVRGTATPDLINIDWLEISQGDEWARGSYQDELATRDTRLLLHGAMRPMTIAGWFGPWWGRFWKDLNFLGPPPDFEVDVHNNWLTRHQYLVTGTTEAEMLALRGVQVNWLRSGFRIQHNFYDLFDAAVGRAEGRLEGEVQLRFRTGQRDPLHQAWRFESTADLVEMAKIFGAGGERMLEPYRYDRPPIVVGHGEIANDAGAFDTHIDLRITSPEAFRYYDFPLQSIVTDVRIDNQRVELPNLNAGYAGGALSAHATVDDGVLTFDASLADADYDLAVETFNTFLDSKSPETTEETEPAGFAARKVNGKLAIKLSASGPLTEFTAYEGKGTVGVTEGDLAQIRLFGPVGDILRPLGIRFGRLDLNKALGHFEVQRENVEFSGLRFTGNTGAIEGAGTYQIPTGMMDFRARLYPLRESNGAVTQLFGVLLDPFSNLLEMRLTGTLKDPKWTLTRNPFAIARELPPTALPKTGSAVEETDTEPETKEKTDLMQETETETAGSGRLTKPELPPQPKGS